MIGERGERYRESLFSSAMGVPLINSLSVFVCMDFITDSRSLALALKGALERCDRSRNIVHPQLRRI